MRRKRRILKRLVPLAKVAPAHAVGPLAFAESVLRVGRVLVVAADAYDALEVPNKSGRDRRARRGRVDRALQHVDGEQPQRLAQVALWERNAGMSSAVEVKGRRAARERMAHHPHPLVNVADPLLLGSVVLSFAGEPRLVHQRVPRLLDDLAAGAVFAAQDVTRLLRRKGRLAAGCGCARLA